MTDAQGNTESLAHQLEVVQNWSGTAAQRTTLIDALHELEALRAAKSEHRRTRREIRRLRRFLQWEPASMVDVIEERNRLKNELFTAKNNVALVENEKAALTNAHSLVLAANRALSAELADAKAKIERLKQETADVESEKTALEIQLLNAPAITKERNTLRAEVDDLKARLEASCIETSRHWHKANGVEDEHAKFVKAMAEALGVPERETRSLVGVASELRRHADAAKQRCSEAQGAAVALAEQCSELRGQNKTLQTQVDAMAKELAFRSAELHDMARRGLWPAPADAKVNTNADVCAVEALEEKLAEAERQRGIAHRACIANQASYEASLASMRAEHGRFQKRVEEVEEENARLIRVFDAVRALMVKS